jgi:luciferase family oxidoreductase group 1
MKLSVLDVAGVLEDTIELARHADALGYERYWVAEHRPQPTPILHATILAGLTDRIRIGTAGILFHYYPALRTAHDYHFLERIYPGRIDAGFCGAMSPATPIEDLEGRTLDDLVASYPDRVRRLVRHLRNTPDAPDFDPALAWSGTLATPPPIWSLGGGLRASQLAAELGIGFGYSLLYKNSVDDPASVQAYRAQFVPPRDNATPQAVVALCGVCAETEAEAKSIAARFDTSSWAPRVVGDRDSCARQLRDFATRYAVDEIVFADLCTGLEARQRCYSLLAR